MIPPFDEATGYLPRGEHQATWPELEAALGFNRHRRRLLEGLLSACRAFRDAGAAILYVDGSFATAKSRPDDYDCCYPSAGIDPGKLDPVLLGLETRERRQAMKAKYLGELWPAEANGWALAFEGTKLELFKLGKDYEHKGILVLDLSTLP